MKQRYSIVATRKGFPAFHQWKSYMPEELNYYIQFMHNAGWSLDIQNVGHVA